MNTYYRFAHVLAVACLPLEVHSSLATIGAALLKNKEVHADHPQAVPTFAAATQKARQESSGNANPKPHQEQLLEEHEETVSSAIYSRLSSLSAKVNALKKSKGTSTAVVIIMMVVVSLLVMACIIFAAVKRSDKQQTNSSLLSPRPQLNSANDLTGSKTSLYNARTATFGGAEHIPPSTQSSIVSGSTTSNGLSYPYGQNHPGSTNSVSSRISTSSAASGNSDVLCLALVVQQADGVKVDFNGSIKSDKQEGVFDVSTAGRTIMKVLFSEFGSDSGILVESVMKAPIAFLNTKKAQSEGPQYGKEFVDRQSASIPDRRVLICRSLAAPSAEPYAVVIPDPSSKMCFQVKRGSTNGALLATVRLEGQQMNMVSGDGQPMATLHGNLAQGAHGPPSVDQLSMNVHPHFDASLVLCSAIASIKLM